MIGLLGVLRFSSSTEHQTESEGGNFIELTRFSKMLFAKDSLYTSNR